MRALLLSLTLIVLSAFTSYSQIVGKVVSITDGDTFVILVDGNRQLKIRLHGIDCPEKGQDFGQVAKKFASDLVYLKVVTVIDKDIDRYGRTIGIVKTPDGKILNEELLKAGLAWHYKRYDHNPYWANLENDAKQNRKGLWSLNSPTAPWDYRHNRK